MSGGVMHPLAALKGAIHTRLAGTAALGALASRIHDGAPRNAVYPFCLIGEGVVRENGTSDGPGVVVELHLTILTKERGHAEGLGYAQSIEAALEASLILTGWRLVLLSLRETVLTQDVANGIARTRLRYRAFVEGQ